MTSQPRHLKDLLWGLALVLGLWAGFVVWCIWNASWSSDHLILWMAHPSTFLEYGLFPLLATLLIWIAQRWSTKSVLARVAAGTLLLGLFALQWHVLPRQGHLLGHAASYDWCSGVLDGVHMLVSLCILAAALALMAPPIVKRIPLGHGVRWHEVLAVLGVLGAASSLMCGALDLLYGFPEELVMGPVIWVFGSLTAIGCGAVVLRTSPLLGWMLVAAGGLAFTCRIFISGPSLLY